MDKSNVVEPLFLDPRAEDGGADILVVNQGLTNCIQCKSRSPLYALDMSFDYFHYLFGCFYRFVQDSGNSYELKIQPKSKLERGIIEELIALLKSAIKSGLHIPLNNENESFSYQLNKLDIPISGISEGRIRKLLDSCKANLFCEVGGFHPIKGDSIEFNRIAILSVSTDPPVSIEDTILNILDKAASEARVKYPLTIAIHFYGMYDFADYLYTSKNSKRLRKRINGVLKSFPGIRSVALSSNVQLLSQQPEGVEQLKTQYLDIKNEYFVDL